MIPFERYNFACETLNNLVLFIFPQEFQHWLVHAKN